MLIDIQNNGPTVTAQIPLKGSGLALLQSVRVKGLATNRRGRGGRRKLPLHKINSIHCFRREKGTKQNAATLMSGVQGTPPLHAMLDAL